MLGTSFPASGTVETKALSPEPHAMSFKDQRGQGMAEQ